MWCPDGRFPRRVVQRDWQGAVQEACACLESAAVDDGRRLYDGCKAEQARCQTSAPDSA